MISFSALPERVNRWLGRNFTPMDMFVLGILFGVAITGPFLYFSGGSLPSSAEGAISSFVLMAIIVVVGAVLYRWINVNYGDAPLEEEEEAGK